MLDAVLAVKAHQDALTLLRKLYARVEGSGEVVRYDQQLCHDASNRPCVEMNDTQFFQLKIAMQGPMSVSICNILFHILCISSKLFRIATPKEGVDPWMHP